MNPKELYRRLEDVISRAFRQVTGPRAVERAAQRVVEELGAELGLRSVQVFEGPAERSPRSPSAASEARVVVAARKRRYELLFDTLPGVAAERIELVVSALGSILSTHLLESSLGNAMRQAEEIQRSLLPQRAPCFGAYEIAVRADPAEQVCGDLYDFLDIEEGTLGLAIGDASGHGLPAALLVRDVVVGLRMGMEKDLKPGHTLSRLNQVIHACSLSSCFVSVFYAELERNGSLFYFNAGHEPPLLFGPTRSTRSTQPTGSALPAPGSVGYSVLAGGDTVIGPLSDARFKRHFAHIDHGETLVLHTDGLIERRSPGGQLFGVERLASTIRECLEQPVEEIVERVFERTDEFGEGAAWDDDATLLVVRRP